MQQPTKIKLSIPFDSHQGECEFEDYNCQWLEKLGYGQIIEAGADLAIASESAAPSRSTKKSTPKVRTEDAAIALPVEVGSLSLVEVASTLTDDNVEKATTAQPTRKKQ